MYISKSTTEDLYYIYKYVYVYIYKYIYVYIYIIMRNVSH